jgi:hypothetical protein
VGAIRTYQDGVNLSDAISVEKNGQATFTERVKIEADSTATTQTTAVIQAIGTNSGIALVPNGTGAITAAIPDGTAAGGNSRGTNSVDLQIARVSADQVTSGINSVIVGGLNNKTVGKNAVIVGGELNLAGNRNTITIVGGENNSNSGGGSFIGAGRLNTISDGATSYNVITGGLSNTSSLTAYSTISGGQSNTASTGTHSSVVGGQSNVASGLHATVIGGNLVNATGSKSVAGGRSSIASGQASFSMGFYTNAQGSSSQALGEEVISGSAFSMASGYQIESYLYGQFARGNGALVNSASSQYSDVLARRLAILTSAATTVLSLDGTGTTNLIVPTGTNRMWNVKVSTVAVVSAITGTATGVNVGDSYMQDDTLLFKKVANISSVVGVNNTNIIADTSMGAASMGYSAGASQELALTFTAPTFAGGGSVTCRVVSKVELVEVAY